MRDHSPTHHVTLRLTGLSRTPATVRWSGNIEINTTLRDSKSSCCLCRIHFLFFVNFFRLISNFCPYMLHIVEHLDWIYLEVPPGYHTVFFKPFLTQYLFTNIRSFSQKHSSTLHFFFNTFFK